LCSDSPNARILVRTLRMRCQAFVLKGTVKLAESAVGREITEQPSGSPAHKFNH